MNPDHLVSIVMPSFNQAAFIGASVESVLSQDYSNLELVVQDGNSTDETPTILKQASAKDSRTKWVSNPDDGPAQAINHALARSKGTIIGWLNSDDLYSAGTIRRAVGALSASPQTIMVYGHGDYIDENGQFLSRYPTKPPIAGIDGFHAGCFICQPTVFFKRSMYTMLGPLDETQRTSFDFEYWLRAFQRFEGRVGFLDALQAQSRLHDGCITNNERRLVALEGIRLTRKYLGRAEPHWAATHMMEIAAASEPGQNRESTMRAINGFLSDIADLYNGRDLDQLRMQSRIILDRAILQ